MTSFSYKDQNSFPFSFKIEFANTSEVKKPY